MERFKPHTYLGEQPSSKVDLRLKRNKDKKGDTALERTPAAQEAIKGVRQVLEGINRQVLFDIFREYYGRSGNDPDTLFLTDLSKVKIIYDPQKAEGTHSLANGPVLNAAKFREGDVDRIINTLIHEYAHESSRSDLLLENLSHGSVVHVKSKSHSGVSTTFLEGKRSAFPFSSTKREEKTVNVMINEGITQIIADEIHVEYVKRTGEGGDSYAYKLRLETSFEANYYHRSISLTLVFILPFLALPQAFLKMSLRVLLYAPI
jgi:hypothetical protein